VRVFHNIRPDRAAANRTIRKMRQIPAGGARILAAAAVALLLGTAPSQAAQPACPSPGPVNTLNEVWSAIVSCWTPPPGSAGMAITLTFSLRRNGTMIGQPRVTWSKLAGDETLQRGFVASVLDALDAALPLPLSDSMGGAIAGRPFALRFAAEAKAPEVSL
jgi:hypothetical protein